MDNYFITAERMMENVEILSSSPISKGEKNRWFIICYLCGYIPECYGKLIMSAFMGYSEVELKKIYGHELKRVNEDVNVLPYLISSSAKYCMDLKIECSSILYGNQKWHPEKRYCAEKGLWDTKSISEIFMKEAKKIMEIIYNMKLDGVIG